MNNDRDRMMNQSGRNMPVTPGTDVYDANGDKVGTVQEFNPQANCIVVQKGMIFTKDLYIPINAIDGRDDKGVYLSLTKDDLKDDRFASPPTSSGAGAMTDSDIVDQNNYPYRDEQGNVVDRRPDLNPDLTRDTDMPR